MSTGKILIVSTSHATLGEKEGPPTGSWLEEVAAPYFVFTEAGYEVEIASVAGGKIPWDPASVSEETGFLTDDAKKFLATGDATKAADNSTKASSISDVSGYAAIFIPGGHGIVWDGRGNPTLQKLLVDFTTSGKVVSSVCHGPAALTGVKLPGGDFLVKGKKITGFSNDEEEAVEKTKYVPFLTESQIKEEGGEYSKKGSWEVYTVTDGKLVTGQNPQSSQAVAKEVVRLLKGQ